jgi:hypothetical protein
LVQYVRSVQVEAMTRPVVDGPGHAVSAAA